MASTDQLAHSFRDLLVANDVREIVVDLAAIITNGQVEIDPDPLRRVLLMTMPTDPTRQDEIAHKHMTDASASVGDAKGVNNPAGFGLHERALRFLPVVIRQRSII